jgi:hypothetical protein
MRKRSIIIIITIISLISGMGYSMTDGFYQVIILGKNAIKFLEPIDLPFGTTINGHNLSCSDYDFENYNDQVNTTWLNLSNMSDNVIVRCTP